VLGPGGKRSQVARARAGAALLAWAEAEGVSLAPALVAHIRDGFGPRPDGDDAFDTAVGLLGVLNIVLGRRPAGEPSDPVIRAVEGWILGQEQLFT